MSEKRSRPKIETPSAVWLGAPYRCWAKTVDASDRGLRIMAPREMPPGARIVVYRVAGEGLGGGRVGTVVDQRGKIVAIDYDREESSDRRSALRRATHNLSARIRGAVTTTATVLDLSASGAAIRPLVPIRCGTKVTLEFLHRDVAVVHREAVVVRSDRETVGLRFAA